MALVAPGAAGFVVLVWAVDLGFSLVATLPPCVFSSSLAVQVTQPALVPEPWGTAFLSRCAWCVCVRACAYVSPCVRVRHPASWGRSAAHFFIPPLGGAGYAASLVPELWGTVELEESQGIRARRWTQARPDRGSTFLGAVA
eukprot:1429759-Pyramimonas_sp.AAC.1